MFKVLKERVLGDSRTVGALAEFKSLYDTADNPDAFHSALAEGNIDRAAEYHPLSADDLRERIDSIMGLGVELTDEYPDIATTGKEEFINS